jgi:hypothetical protein
MAAGSANLARRREPLMIRNASTALALAGAVAFLALGLTPSRCWGQFVPPPSAGSWDVSLGGTVTDATGTLTGFDPIAVLGGYNGGGEGGNDTIFVDNAYPDFINISRAQTVPLVGVILYNAEDNDGSGNRATWDFQLIASSTNAASPFVGDTSVYDQPLVPETAVTNETGAGTLFLFSEPTTSTSFQAIFYGRPINFSDAFNGPRIFELEALTAVPEPSAVFLSGIALPPLLLAARRRHKVAGSLPA